MNELEIINEIGKKLTEAVVAMDAACYPYNEIITAKDLLNKLRSLHTTIIKESPDVHSS